MTELEQQIRLFFCRQSLGREFSAGQIAVELHLPADHPTRMKIAAACQRLIHQQLLDFRSARKDRRRGTKFYFRPPR